MGRIICAYSGVEFLCEHLPLSISSREITHPLFHLPKKKLIALAAQWSAGKLTPTESYLLYLSLFNSTDLIEWRTPVQYTPHTASIIANNMESLLHIIGKIDLIQHPSFTLPHFVISQDTRTLENSYYWIQVWIQTYNEWADNIKSHHNDQELMRRENALAKLIKSSHKKIEDFPTILAGWARTAGEFPEEIFTKVRGINMSLADYWEHIIIQCAKAETIFQIPQKDLTELIEHCEDYIVMDGSIHAMALMKYLRKGQEMQKSYLGLSDSPTSFKLLKPGESAHDANIQNMIDTAPETEPKRQNYATLIAYIKDKAKWNVAQAYKEKDI